MGSSRRQYVWGLNKGRMSDWLCPDKRRGSPVQPIQRRRCARTLPSPPTPGHAGGHGWSGFAGAIKHPTNAKPVSKTAKITTPKHLLQRHFNLSAVRERLEETFRFRTRVRLKVDGNVVAWRESKAHGFRGICSHQHMTA